MNNKEEVTMNKTPLQKIRKAPVKITLGDKERSLRFTLNSFADIEDHFGSIDAGLSAMEKGSMKAIRFFLWTGFTHEDPALTEEQVGALIDIQELEQLTECLSEALESDLPEPEEAKKDNNGLVGESPNA